MSKRIGEERFYYHPWLNSRDTSVDYSKKLEERMRVTKEDIEEGLRRLGLGRNDLVMVHSSLSSLGYVVGGADAVIDALLETVGPEGTVAMPTYSINAFKYVEEEDRCYELSEEFMEPYDPEKTPVWTGLLPETFRKRKNAIRSLSPRYSIAAIGPKAREMAEGDWGEKLQELDGYVLMLGVKITNNSLAEGAAVYALGEAGYKEKIVRKGRYAITLGPWPDLTKMEELYKKEGVMKVGRIGQATARLLKARPMVSLTMEAVKSDPERFCPRTY